MNILNPKILLPKHIDYIIINQDLIIVDYSPKVVYFFDFPEDLNKGNDIREGIPELIGTEETINQILEMRQNDFDLKAITRVKENNQIIYFDLYINFYQNDGE
jgi:adenylate cyclase